MTDKVKATSLSRRSLLKAGGAAALGGAAVMAMPNIVRAQEKRVVTPSFGGSYETLLRQAIMDPFTAETGIEVVFSGTPDLARLKAQVQSGRVEWDFFDATGAWGPSASAQGLFEPLDPNIVNFPGLLLGQKGDYVKLYRSAGVISWNPRRFDEDKHPTDFASFWDVEKFPGRRSVRNRIDYLLDLALVADGVDPKNVYPLDIERGFAAIERLKPSVAKWAESAAQSIQLVTSNEVDFGFNFNNRVRAAITQGDNIQMALGQTMLSNEYLGVTKGSRNAENAMRLLAFSLRPEVQANLASIMSFVPGNPDAIPLLPQEVYQWMPDPSGSHIAQDDEWWVENLEKLQTRFVELMLL